MLDIFFEALNYETIEQKKAYEVAALLGKGGTGTSLGSLLVWKGQRRLGGVHSLESPSKAPSLLPSPHHGILAVSPWILHGFMEGSGAVPSLPAPFFWRFWGWVLSVVQGVEGIPKPSPITSPLFQIHPFHLGLSS